MTLARRIPPELRLILLVSLLLLTVVTMSIAFNAAFLGSHLANIVLGVSPNAMYPGH